VAGRELEPSRPYPLVYSSDQAKRTAKSASAADSAGALPLRRPGWRRRGRGPGESTGGLYRVVSLLASPRFCLPALLPVKLGCPSASPSPSTGASEMPSVPVFDGFVFGADFVLRCFSVRPIKVGAKAFPPTGLRLLRSDSPDPSLANLDSISVLLISSTATVVCLSVRFWGTPWGVRSGLLCLTSAKGWKLPANDAGPVLLFFFFDAMVLCSGSHRGGEKGWSDWEARRSMLSSRGFHAVCL